MNSIIKKFKEINGEQKLFTFHGPFSLLLTGGHWVNSKESPVNIPMPTLYIGKGREMKIILSDDAYQGHAKSVFLKYLDNKITLNDLLELYNISVKDIEGLYSEVRNIDLKKVSNEELELLIKRAERYLCFLIARTIYAETFDKQIAFSVVSERYKGPLENVWSQATHPYFESFESRRNRQLGDLINKYSDETQLAAQARYLFTDYYFPKNDTEIIKEIKNFNVNSVSEYFDSKEDFAKWIETLLPEDRKVAMYIQFVMELRDIRKDPIAKCQASIADIALEMAARAGFDAQIVPHLTSQEYAKGFKWIAQNLNNLKNRLNGVVLLAYEDTKLESEAIDPDLIIEDVDSLFPKDKILELKGQVACKGKIQGIVRVVLDPHNDKGFKNGDILVTSMTRPEFVPIMKKAGAVITNEGGVTCHAAIISRELKIPCIIGTKNATQVLKDGNIVEVDADKGVIRIIE